MWAATYTGVSAWLPEHPVACVALGAFGGLIMGVWLMLPKK